MRRRLQDISAWDTAGVTTTSKKPSLRGSDGCADDADWLYDAGEKGLKGCDHIASEPAKVEKRCSRRVGEDGVPALEACKQTCGKC